MLSEQELWAALTCASEAQRARSAPAAWIDRLINGLRRELEAASFTRQSGQSDEVDWEHDWISARETAERMSWSLRRVQRHADKLCGRRNGGRWFFDPAIIDQHTGSSAA